MTTNPTTIVKFNFHNLPNRHIKNVLIEPITTNEKHILIHDLKSPLTLLKGALFLLDPMKKNSMKIVEITEKIGDCVKKINALLDIEPSNEQIKEIKKILKSIKKDFKILREKFLIELEEKETLCKCIDNAFKNLNQTLNKIKTIKEKIFSEQRISHNINIIVNNIVQCYINACLLYKIDVIKNYGELPLCKIYKFSVHYALQNLLNNAFEAVKNAQIKQKQINVSTEPYTDNDIPYVAISIGDNGSPIDKKLIQNLKAGLRYTTKEGGSGIGLKTVIHMAELHGGQVWITSKPPLNVIFTILLPV